jgi:N-acetylglucosaminyl-diphospho-decaprenol L-rhamnosyltransferase
VSPAPDVAIVTVSHGSAGVLPQFLDSVARSTRRRAVVVVIDNADEDAARDIAGERGHLYQRTANRGYGAGMNAGVAIAPATTWLVLANPDVEFEVGAIDRLIDTAEETGAGSVGPRIRDASGAVYPSARPVPSLRMGVGHALLGRAWPQNPWTRRYHDPLLHDRQGPLDVGWLSGSCLVLRRSVFEAVGGFDDGYFMYFEDVDLGYRLGREGFRNVYEPRAVIVHTGAHSTSSNAAAMVDAHHRSARRFIERRYPGPWLAPVRLVLDVGLRVRNAVERRRVRREAQAVASSR